MMKIFITGASSGIGEALAYAYSKRKCIVGLSARRVDLLKGILIRCEKLGGSPFMYKLDVQNPDDCKLAAHSFMLEAGGIDCVIANAGIGGDDNLYSGSSSNINNILNTNLQGVNNILMPFIPKMKEQKKGKLVCISSVAGYIPIPFHGGYAGSKIALRMIFDSWRPTLEKDGIKTICICPGFIDTPIVKGPARKIPMVSPDKAAEKFIHFINKGKRTIIYPWYYRILIFLTKIVPKRLYTFLINKCL